MDIIVGLWLAAQLPAAAENYFTDADADGIRDYRPKARSKP
jgi:hypothetical protein